MFENNVLSIIAEADFSRAEFFNGTLFVESDGIAAQRIYEILDNVFGNIQFNAVIPGVEYAYDFV